MKINSFIYTYISGLLLILFMVFIVLLNYIKVYFPVSDFRINHELSANLLNSFIIILPSIWLIRSKVWINTSNKLRKLLLVSLTIFLLSTAYSIRVGINTGGFFLLITSIYAIRERKIHKPPFIFYLFWIYLLYQTLSLFWTEDLNIGYSKLQTYYPFATIPLAFCCFIITREELDRIILVIFRGAFLFVALSLICWVYESNRLGIPLSKWFVTHKELLTTKACFEIVYSWTNYVHPTYNSIFYITALVFGFYLKDNQNIGSKINSIELSVFLIACVILISITQSRIAFISLTLITATGIGWIFRFHKTFFKSYIVFCLAMGLFILIFFQNKLIIFATDPARKELYDIAFAYIKMNYIHGTGIGGMAKILDSFEYAQSLGYSGAMTGIGNPHNQFIGELMQTGIGGFIILCVMIFYLYYSSIKRKNWILLAFLLSFLPIMMIEMPFSLFKGVTYFVPFACLLLQWQPENKLENNQQ